jgi:hypothetical protein
MNDRSFLELLASLTFVKRDDAAKDQLETAIWLWFHEDDEKSMSDPSSVHTLAVAAQGVLTAIARDKDIEPSAFVQAVRKQPQKVQDWIRNPQNFFKHGHYGDRSKKPENVPHHPDLTSMILADNISTFNRLFGTSTPLMDLFLLRYGWLFQESKVSLKTLEIELAKRIKIKEAAGLNRVQFLKVLLPLIVEISAPDRKAFAEKGFI